MVQGAFDTLIAEYGKGIPVIGRAVGREILGTSPGAKTKASLWISLPPASETVKHALVSIGLEAPQDLRPPFKIKIAMERTSITREFRPQFHVELDDTIYYKAVYDVKPLLAEKLAKWDLHKFVFLYDRLHPLFIRDISLIVVFEHEKSEYYLSVLTGAKSLEPGDTLVEYPKFNWSFGGERRYSLVIHSPYHSSQYEVVVAGSEPVSISGAGSHVVQGPFSYKGSLIPVSVKYLPSPYKFYPRTAVLTDIVLFEEKVLAPVLDIDVEEVKIDENEIRVKINLSNKGAEPVRKIVIAMIALGLQLSSRKINKLDPNSSLSLELKGRLSLLPAHPSKAYINITGISLGRRLQKSLELELEK